MKVNQIVSEHKKGVRAMKYGKKTKGAVPVYGPDAKNVAKLKPVKPVGPGSKVDEAVLKAFDPGKQAVISDPDKGTDITLDLTKPQNMAALKPNDQGQLEYDPTPDMAAQGAQQAPAENPLKPGAEIAIKADEAGDIGGDATDDFIDDVVDHDFERAQGREQGVDEESEVPYFVKAGPQPMAMTTPKPTAIVGSTKWTAITPEIEAKASAQGFRKVMLKHNGQLVPGLEGGDMKLGSKIIVAPSDFQAMSATGDASAMRRPMGVQSAEKTGLREADDILLDKMLTIAGLR